MNLSEKILESEYLYNGKILNLRKDRVTLPNGKTATREIVELTGAAAIMPITEDNEIIFVRQYRCPFSEILLEIPAGKIDEGESPDICAERELREETGAVAKNIEKLGVIYPSPGCLKEKLHLFVATGLEFTNLSLDSDEFLEVLKIPYKKALQMVTGGEIVDGKTVAAILLYNQKLTAKE